MKSKHELHLEAHEQIKEIIKAMNGLSEEEFSQEYYNEPAFHNGFNVLVEVFLQAKFDV